MTKKQKKPKNTAFANQVRRVQSGVSINFFTGFADTAAAIDDKSTTNAVLSDTQKMQIFQPDTEMLDNIASFDGVYSVDGNFVGTGVELVLQENQLKGAVLINADSNTGWIGNMLGDQQGVFAKPQILAVNYDTPRRLPSLKLVGFDKNNYPTDFEIVINHFDGTQYTVTQSNAIFDGESSYRFEFDNDDLMKDSVVIGVELRIFGWSRGWVLPRIRAFVGEMNESFDNRSLQSIEVLEEKTASIDKLSYDISSNMCKVSFLNRDKKFYNPDYYAMLKANRSVIPYVKIFDQNIQDPEMTEKYFLGRYFSKNWNLNDSSAFVSVTAYDTLYSLQSVDINFGMDEKQKDATTGLQIGAYKDMTVLQILDRVFELINNVRRNMGIFESIKYDIQLDQDKQNLTIPYVLIERQDAWLVLQSIGKLCGAYVYMDREGIVTIVSDQTASTVGVEQRDSSTDKSYRVVDMEYTIEDQASIKENGLNEFEYDATLFAVPVKSDNYDMPTEIETLAQGLLTQYKNGVGYVETEWWGDPELQLGSIFLAQSQYEDKPRVYECMRNEIRRNSSGYRMKTTGRELLGHNPKDYPDNIKINPSNAFSFGIPVLSRTIVNRVIVKCKLLVEDLEPETITIKRENCKPIVDQNKNPTGKYTATVKLEKVYDNIASVVVQESDEQIPVEIVGNTADSIIIVLDQIGESKEVVVVIS